MEVVSYQRLLLLVTFSALPVLAVVHKADKGFFKKALKENIQFSVITDFVTSQHTFNVFIEILFVLFTLFTGIMIAFSSKEEKYKYVNKLFNTIALFLGIYILIVSIYYFTKDIGNFINVEKFEEFSLPIILGIWFIPFLYFLYLYIVYEGIFIAMNSSITNDKIREYAKKQAIISFNFDLDLLKRWKNSLFIAQVETKEDVLISILDIKRLQLIEKNPPKVDITKGWSPYESKDFLDGNGIHTNHYKRAYDDEWLSVSPYVKLDEEIIGNNIAYYVIGSNSIAKKLELVLNINYPIKGDSAIAIFLQHVDTLYKKALLEDLPISLRNSIYRKQDKTMTLSNKRVSIHRIDYIDKLKGYTIKFVIEQI